MKPAILKSLEFELDGNRHECAISAYNLTSDQEILEWQTLCPEGSGSLLGKAKFALEITGYHDYSDPGSLSWMLIQAALAADTDIPFKIVDGGLTIEGELSAVAFPSLGGEVNTLQSFTVTLALAGPPSITATPPRSKASPTTK